MKSALTFKDSKSFLIGTLALALLSGCATSKGVSSNLNSSSDSDLTSVYSEANKNPVNAQNSRMTSQGEIIIRGMKLQNTEFDYPITINSRVLYWIDYFTGRGRPHFARYLERSEYFIPYIIPILKAHNVPTDLVYQAMIESGFNNHARSTAKAVGPWQFIPATGRRYGMMVNWWVDERRDTYKSTVAAIEYMRDLYKMMGSWELASASYNAGEAKIARAIRRYGTKDFWVIARQNYLRAETRDYVPKIIAAAIVAKNRTQFGFPASTVHPGAGEIVARNGQVVKVQDAASEPAPKGADEEEEGTVSTMLVEAEEDALEEGSETPELAVVEVPVKDESKPLARPIPTPQVSKKGEVSGEQLVEFEIQGPADLEKVARAAGLSYQTVKSLNPEILRWCTPPSLSTYRIKLPVSTKEKFLQTYNHEAFPRKVQFPSYKARNGESVARIAHKFGIKADPIADLNGISASKRLRKGATVLLPLPNDHTRSLAALDVRDPPEKRKRRIRSASRRRVRAHKVSYKRREAARSRSRADGS